LLSSGFSANYTVTNEQCEIKSRFCGPKFFEDECEAFEKLIKDRDCSSDSITFCAMHVHAKYHQIKRAQELILRWYFTTKTTPPTLLFTDEDLENIISLYRRTWQLDKATFWKNILHERSRAILS
jgi:hypothetical protein